MSMKNCLVRGTMKRRTIILQIQWLFRQREAMLSMFIITALCLYNFGRNVLAFRGMDVIYMYQPMKLMLLSFNRTYYQADMTMLMMQIYPLLVTLPAGFCFFADAQQGKAVYMISRIGKPMYYSVKLLATFGVTFFQFTIPFLAELALYCISFPMSATGDLSQVGFLSREYAEIVDAYVFSDLYIYHPILYTILGILWFGMISGILAMVSVVFGELCNMKYRVFVFLPVFILIRGLEFMEQLFPSSALNIYRYLFLFFDEERNARNFGIVIGSIVIFVILGCIYCARREKIV